MPVTVDSRSGDLSRKERVFNMVARLFQATNDAPPYPPPSPTPTIQVIMNDQSTRYCAWGDTANCTPEIQGTMSGWPRYTPPPSSPPSQEHREGSSANAIIATADGNTTGRNGEPYLYEGGCVNKNGPAGEEGVCWSDGNETRMSRSGYDNTDSGDTPVASEPARSGKDVVEYRLLEFGLMSPLQGFSYWPGFSLNPALWDLGRLRGYYGRKFGRKFEFDPTDNRSGSCRIRTVYYNAWFGCSFSSV